MCKTIGRFLAESVRNIDEATVRCPYFCLLNLPDISRPLRYNRQITTPAEIILRFTLSLQMCSLISINTSQRPQSAKPDTKS